MGPYFFCGIGGSGMLPLALILLAQGCRIAGSDRSRDQGRTPEKFDWIAGQGISLFPQDGSGLTADFEALVVSGAIEETVPEVVKARALGMPVVRRADLLARIFNQADVSIGIGGTSGKSTTTGMTGWILSATGCHPTVMNGANFLNFVTPDAPYASSLIGAPDLFVSECDESDGSIVLYHSAVAVLNNITLDHKPVAELIPVFRQFLDQSARQVLNLDCPVIAENFAAIFKETALTYGLENPAARLVASGYAPQPVGSLCQVMDRETGESAEMILQVPGKYNVSNALASVAAAMCAGVSLHDAVRALAAFRGVARRMELVGKSNDISVMDDFAHNPDKVKASLSACREHPGRLLVMFQMHGFGPLRLMRAELLEAFRAGLTAGDVLLMPEVLYLGGTVDRSYTAHDFINEINGGGAEGEAKGEWFETRAEILPRLVALARPGDRIIVMGARDDTLSGFARDVLAAL